MTRRTVGDFLRRPDVVFLHEPGAESLLRLIRLPLHGEYLGARPDELRRISMTLQAPFHRQRVFTPHQRHRVDAAMTGHAADALAQVNAVVEVDIAREIVYTHPFQWDIVAEASPDRFEHGAVGIDLGMTIQAGFRRWNPGE